MKKILSFLALFLVSACSICLSQGMRLSQPNPTRLRVVVYYEDGQERVRDVTVEIQDGVGGSSAMSSMRTGPDGMVEFNTVTGEHRVRIYGGDIQPFEAEFEIAPVETNHQENFRVKRKPNAGTATSQETGGGFIPAVRLKIPDEAMQEYQRGGRAMTDKNWESARKSFQAAIVLYPDFDMAYNGLGSANWQLVDVAGAKAAFQKAIELNDKYAEAQRNLARIMISQHHWVEAAALLNQSLGTEPNHAWALTNVAYAELQLHRFQEAAAHALKVHALPHEGLANAHVIAGYALDALGQREESLAQWKQYLKEDPKGLNAKRAEEQVRRLTNAPQS